MRLNVIIIISCLLIGFGSCNSSKSTKTAKSDATEVVDKTVEKVKEAVTEVVKAEEEAVEIKAKETAQTKMEEKESKATSNTPTKQMNTNVKEAVKEKKEAVQTKMEKDESKTKANANAPVKQMDAKDIAGSKTKAAASAKMQEQQADLVGKYKWLKRVCCGRMQKTTLPEAGEETFMTLTEDGKVLYSGTPMKNAENCEYNLDMNFRSFPDRPMLKMGKKIPALISFYGDTLLINRGYIDLDKNYWLKVE